jgi:hypothetical protein
MDLICCNDKISFSDDPLLKGGDGDGCSHVQVQQPVLSGIFDVETSEGKKDTFEKTQRQNSSDE